MSDDIKLQDRTEIELWDIAMSAAMREGVPPEKAMQQADAVVLGRRRRKEGAADE